MPRWINLQQVTQPDGAIHHVSGVGCPIDPCAIIDKAGIKSLECGYLEGVMIDEDVEIRWQCHKPPCTSAV